MAGNTVTSRLAGSKSGRRLTIADLTLTAAGGTATAKGGLSVNGFDGAVALSIPDAQVLSRLLGRELDGQLSMTASGKASFDGSLEMAVKGRADGIAAGTDLLGQLVAGQSGIEGKIARDGQGALRFQSLSLQTHALSAQLDGRLGPDGSDAKLSGRIADLARVLPESSGALAVELTIAGRGAARHIAARLSATEATVRGAPLRDVVVSYQGRGDRASQDGTLSAAGGIGEARLTGAGQLAYGGVQGLTIRDLKLALGENRMEANITLPPAGDARGAASLTIANAGQLAPILGIALEDSASIDAQLQGTAEAPGITAVAHSDRFRVGTIQVEGGVAELDIANALNQPVISGIVQARGLSAGERRITALTLNATPQADRTALTVSAVIDGQWRVAGAALADFTDWQPNVSLHDVSVRTGATVLAQEGTAQLSSAGPSLRVDHLVLATGKGRIAATIEAGETLTGKIEIRRFPAQFGGLFTPGIEPAGIIDGTVELAGEAAAPEIGYRLLWQEASLTGRLPPGFPSLDLNASGALRGDDLHIDAAASGPGGLSLKATGALRGVRAATKFDLKAAGTVPLSLADAFLASRGTHLDGRAAIDLTVSGQAAKPVIEGRVTASGAAVTDPATGIALKDARLTARLAGGVLHIETLDARSEQGASLAASGTLGILGSKALPADLRIKANALRFNDQRVVTGEISGDVTLKGDLNGQSAVSGGFDVARLDIQIPRSMPASVEALDLQHKNAPDYIAAAQRARQSGEASSLPSTIKLALTLNSANRIFVTGRGLDAQLGGALQLLGSADTPRAIGAFTLERGKLALLGRSLEFTSGTINFGGDLDPVLAFLAVVEMSGMRIEVRVSGQASDPKFAFSSNPELPEDEIVALLLFNKSIGELSPLQIAQLASEVSELGGLSSGPGLLGQLKSAVGIDTLNMTTDAKGDAVFSAGSYLSDKVFVGVEQGTSGASSRVKVDLGITKHLKLRGETDADGKSKLGVGVEWEY